MPAYKPPARIALPDPNSIDTDDPVALTRYLAALNAAVAELSGRAVMKEEPSSRILMLSQNGSTYVLTVSDLGVVSTSPVNVVP